MASDVVLVSFAGLFGVVGGGAIVVPVLTVTTSDRIWTIIKALGNKFYVTWEYLSAMVVGTLHTRTIL